MSSSHPSLDQTRRSLWMKSNKKFGGRFGWRYVMFSLLSPVLLNPVFSSYRISTHQHRTFRQSSPASNLELTDTDTAGHWPTPFLEMLADRGQRGPHAAPVR